MLVQLAGGGQKTLLSEVGSQYLLPLFTTAEACALRLVCREFLAAVTEQPWEDSETVIKGSIAAWRACFPHALCANVAENAFEEYEGTGLFVSDERSTLVEDADFVHFRGLRVLNMTGCPNVTDAAFAHLRGIHTLIMRFCGQMGITDAAFANLCGIHTLDMSFCSQAGITDAAFAHLRGIHSLDMSGCRQRGRGITDAAFAHLRGIHTLNMSFCNQPVITEMTPPFRTSAASTRWT